MRATTVVAFGGAEYAVGSMLSPEALLLCDYMSELSEAAYFAGWMHDLEFELWDRIISGPSEYGRLSIWHEHIERLLQLANAANGWIICNDVKEQILVPFDEWQARFAPWKKRARLNTRKKRRLASQAKKAAPRNELDALLQAAAARQRAARLAERKRIRGK